jgi:TPR repeat protein
MSDSASRGLRAELTARLIRELPSWYEAAEGGDQDAIGGPGQPGRPRQRARTELEKVCGQAADRGDLAMMDRIRGLLLFDLADRPNGGISLEVQMREEERWYRRAAEGGSGPAIVQLARLLDWHDRHEEAAEGQRSWSPGRLGPARRG